MLSTRTPLLLNTLHCIIVLLQQSAISCHMKKKQKQMDKKTEFWLSHCEHEFLFLARSAVRFLFYKRHTKCKEASRSSAPKEACLVLAKSGVVIRSAEFGGSRGEASHHNFCLYWEACTQFTGNT